MVEDSNRLSVGAVGLGYFAQLHLDAWQAIDRVNLVAVTDRDPSKVAAAVRDRGVEGTVDLEAMLQASGSLDILDLAVPPSAHNGLIRQALGKVSVIICQKPFCENLEVASAVTGAAREAGTTLLIHENFRFQPWYRTLKAWLDSGQMGRVYQARFALRPGDGRGAEAYLMRQPTFQQMKRFLIHETGVHFLDLLPWLFGEVSAIYAETRQLNPVIAGEDAAMFILEHANGVRSVLDGNRLSDHVAQNPRLTMGEMIVEGEQGTVKLDGFGALRFRRFGENTESLLTPSAEGFDPQAFGGGCVEALNRHVVDAMDGHGAFENEAEQYLSVLELCEAAYRSAESGHRIVLK